MRDMYSAAWFDTFAATVPAAINDADLEGICAALPLAQYPRLLDVGCGIGRIAGPLAARGYEMTGLDANVAALVDARQRAPGPRYVALDQRHAGCMRWTFDGAILLWNSLGFVGREADLETVAGLASALRPGGRLVFDLYHPDWLRRNERAGETDDRGASVRRWMAGTRCCHEIRYPDGRVDDIQFDVYQPQEMRDLCQRSGLEPVAELVWWKSASRPGADFPRYQLVFAAPG